jgi:outer membrane protein assembly factor BamB
MKILSIVASALALAAGAELASAQWTQFHGDAQRTGSSPHVGPAAPKLLWSRAVGGPVISSPILGSDGAIYLGSVLQEGLHPSYGIVATNPDGTPRWTFPTGFVDTQTLSSPAIGPNGNIHVGAQDGRFYALKPDGTLAWSFQGQSPVRQHPAIAQSGDVYVGIDGDLHAFSATGALLWTAGNGELGFPGGPSLATDGTIYITGGVQGSATKLYAFNPDGSTRWVYQLWNPYFFPLAPPTVGPDGTVHTHAERMYAIRPDGTLKWQRELLWGASSYGSAAVDRDGNLYYAADWHVWKLDPNGNILWEYTIDDGCGGFLGHSISSPLVDAAGRVYVGLGNGRRSAVPCEKRLVVLSPSGALLSTFDLPEIPGASAPALAADGTLYVGCLDGKLYALKP